MNRGLIAGAALVSILCGSAQAEMGKASAGPGEWFLGLNGGGGASWGPEHQAYIHQDGPSNDNVDFDNGAFYFLGLEAGYVLADPTSLLDRIELSVDLRGRGRSLTRNPGQLAFIHINEDNSSTFIGRASPDQVVKGDDETTDYEFRLSFKNTLFADESHVVLVGFEPFVRFQDTESQVETNSVLGAPFAFARRSDDVEAEYYGAQLAVEVERPISDSLSLIGRAAAGAYYVTADIDTETAIFQFDPFGVPASDSDSTWGGRFGAAAGIKIPLHYAGASLTVMGTVDYMTDVATIDHLSPEEANAGKHTQAGFDDALELGGRVGLVFPLR